MMTPNPGSVPSHSAYRVPVAIAASTTRFVNLSGRGLLIGRQFAPGDQMVTIARETREIRRNLD